MPNSIKVDCNSTQPPFCCVSNFLIDEVAGCRQEITVINDFPDPFPLADPWYGRWWWGRSKLATWLPLWMLWIRGGWSTWIWEIFKLNDSLETCWRNFHISGCSWLIWDPKGLTWFHAIYGLFGDIPTTLKERMIMKCSATHSDLNIHTKTIWIFSVPGLCLELWQITMIIMFCIEFLQS